MFCGQVLPYGARRDSRSAGSIRRAPPEGRQLCEAAKPSGLVSLISLAESLDWPRALRSAGGSFFFCSVVCGMRFFGPFSSCWCSFSAPLIPFGAFWMDLGFHFGFTLASICEIFLYPFSSINLSTFMSFFPASRTPPLDQNVISPLQKQWFSKKEPAA